jgi:hypothetical protein
LPTLLKFTPPYKASKLEMSKLDFLAIFIKTVLTVFDNVGFQVFMAMSVWMVVFWDVASYSLYTNVSEEYTYCLHLQVK